MIVLAERPRRDMSDEALIERYQLNGDTMDRDEVVLRYIGESKKLSRRYARNVGWSIEREDLFQEGMARLLRRAGDYDPEKGASFSTFAIMLLKKGMRDSVISQGWGTSRFIKSIPRVLAKLDRFYAMYGRFPDEQEELDLLGEKDYKRFKEGKFLGRSNKATGKPADTGKVMEDAFHRYVTDHREEDPLHKVSREERYKEVTRGLEGRDKTAVFLFLGQEMKQEEIAKALGVTEAALYARMKRNHVMDNIRVNAKRLGLLGGLEGSQARLA